MLKVLFNKLPTHTSTVHFNYLPTPNFLSFPLSQLPLTLTPTLTPKAAQKLPDLQAQKAANAPPQQPLPSTSCASFASQPSKDTQNSQSFYPALPNHSAQIPSSALCTRPRTCSTADQRTPTCQLQSLHRAMILPLRDPLGNRAERTVLSALQRIHRLQAQDQRVWAQGLLDLCACLMGRGRRIWQWGSG